MPPGNIGMHHLASFIEQWTGRLSTVLLTFLGICLFILFIVFCWERLNKYTASKNRPLSIRGGNAAAYFLIVGAGFVVLATGLAAPQVMVGDEVTHFYMLTEQARDLSQPNFFAEIPLAMGGTETRSYPHSFLWHYFGAVIYTATGGAFAAIQCYQAVFLLQMLAVAFLLARKRQGVDSLVPFFFVLILVSLPLTLVFSVTFYQDVPMTAQILTSFFLLRERRWFFASCFMLLAVGFKVTAILFFPAFFILLFFWQWQRRGWFAAMLAAVCALLLILGGTWGIGRAIEVYGKSYFYPVAQLESLLKNARSALGYERMEPEVKKETGPVDQERSEQSLPKKRDDNRSLPEIANHPGDLRIPSNALVYGGVVLWLAVLLGFAGCAGKALAGHKVTSRDGSGWWLLFVGGSYTLLAAWFVKTAPDARFFLPGLPFLLLPVSELAQNLPRFRAIVALCAALAMLQSGYVVKKTYSLRSLSSEMKEAIQWLQDHPPEGHIFMYPEGNYRFFPSQHEWYLGYRLRDFWRADNDKRLLWLQKFQVSHIVVKKYLVAEVDRDITNLGIYPVHFIEDIEHDPRFVKTFSNRQFAIYRIGSPTRAE